MMDRLLRQIFFIGIISMVSFAQVWADEAVNTVNGEIAIVASTPIPQGLSPNMKSFEEIKKCGFNTIFYYSNSVEEINKVLHLAENNGIKVFVSSNILRTDKCVDFVEKLKNNYTIAGWDFVDEPQMQYLTQLKLYYDKISVVDPNRLVFINLIGSKIKKFVGNSPDMFSYLDTIQQIFAPQLWCYDYYPFSVKNGKVSVSRDGFYSDLEAFSEMSRRTQRPFWMYCQSTAFKNSVVERPALKEAYLRYVAFSGLAYGVQGLLYWTYGQRNSTQYEDYLSALVDQKGKKTKAWNYVRKVNQEIKVLNEVFYRATLVECRHTGANLYEGTKRLTESIGPLRKIIGGSQGVMVSHLHTAGRNYIIVVSHDPFKSQTIVMHFDEGYKIKELLPIVKGDTSTLSYNKVNLQVKKTLSPGGYAIYSWE